MASAALSLSHNKIVGARACYGFGGPLCLTDVNLLLGRLDPARFSAPLFPEESGRRLDEMLANGIRSREDIQ